MRDIFNRECEFIETILFYGGYQIDNCIDDCGNTIVIYDSVSGDYISHDPIYCLEVAVIFIDYLSLKNKEQKQ